MVTKKIVEYGLEGFKTHWRLHGIDMDYEIFTPWFTNGLEDEFQIKLFVIINKKPLLIISAYDKSEEECWERLCHDIVLAGITKLHESTVLMARDHDRGTPLQTTEESLKRKYPLTPDECFTPNVPDTSQK